MEGGLTCIIHVIAAACIMTHRAGIWDGHAVGRDVIRKMTEGIFDAAIGVVLGAIFGASTYGLFMGC